MFSYDYVTVHKIKIFLTSRKSYQCLLYNICSKQGLSFAAGYSRKTALSSQGRYWYAQQRHMERESTTNWGSMLNWSFGIGLISCWAVVTFLCTIAATVESAFHILVPHFSFLSVTSLLVSWRNKKMRITHFLLNYPKTARVIPVIKPENCLFLQSYVQDLLLVMFWFLCPSSNFTFFKLLHLLSSVSHGSSFAHFHAAFPWSAKSSLNGWMWVQHPAGLFQCQRLKLPGLSSWEAVQLPACSVFSGQELHQTGRRSPWNVLASCPKLLPAGTCC